jgi:hypothetical protein
MQELAMIEVSRHQAITIAAEGSTSGAFNLRETGSGGGAVLFPAAFNGTEVSFVASTSLAGTYAPVLDVDNAAVTMSVTTSSWLALPTEVLTHRYAKIVSNSSEAAARSMHIVTKMA